MPQQGSAECVSGGGGSGGGASGTVMPAIKPVADLSTSVDTSNSSTPATAPPASTTTTTSNDDPAADAGDAEMETSMTTAEVHQPQHGDTVPQRHVRLSKRPDDFDEMLTSADESELDPLQWRNGKDVDKDALSNSNVLELEDDGDQWSKDFDRDSQSPASRKRGSRIRCVVVVVLVMIVIAGVAAIVLMFHQRMQVEPIYQFQFARYYGHHMVLQRAPSKAVIWGYGPVIDDNTVVSVTLDNNSTRREVYNTTVRYTAAGRIWKVVLDPVSDSRPYTITATLVASPVHTVQLGDVLFGDVWLCAGQNKLHHSLAKILQASAKTQQKEAFHEIRLFSLFPAKSDKLWYDLRGIQLRWSVPKSLVNGTNSSTAAIGAHFPSVCWLFGKHLHERLVHAGQRRPLGLVSVTYSDSVIDEWLPSYVIDTCDVKYSDSSSRIWNGMIHPLLDLPIFGAVWHQGRKGVSSSEDYSCLIPGLVNYWRQAASNRTWNSTNPLFPIGIVQLRPEGGFDEAGDDDERYRLTAARWHQTANYGYLPNEAMRRTFLAVTIDLPDEDSNHSATAHISSHSQQKRQIAARLVLGALNVAYRQSNVSFRGPWPTEYKLDSTKLRLSFDSGFYIHRQHSYIGFEICCTDNPGDFCPPASRTDTRGWFPAPILQAQSTSPNAVVLSTSSCDHERLYVVGVRYAWRRTPCQEECAVYSSSRLLPMSPFIRISGLVADDQWNPVSQQPLQFPGHKNGKKDDDEDHGDDEV